MLYYCQNKREKKVGMGLMLDMYALLLSKQEREKGRNGYQRHLKSKYGLQWNR